MAITKAKINQCINLVKKYGGTKLVLFGSALENPETANDLDLACDGVEGWKIFELGARLEELIAASAFLAQFYSGIENILKRFYRFFNEPLPKGADWHINLFRSFCEPPMKKLPMLFSKKLEERLVSFRKFRHVVHHGYGLKLDCEILKPGIDAIYDIFNEFRKTVRKVLTDLKNEDLES